MIITGNKAAADTKAERKFLHQGIAERNFERKFQLGDHVKVVGAFMENGLLNIDLQREIPIKILLWPHNFEHFGLTHIHTPYLFIIILYDFFRANRFY